MYLNEELLFWKVFRNVFLFSKIMSFMDTHLSLQYESILSVYQMIESKQYSILRDKVVRNQNLTFNEHTEQLQIKISNDRLVQIFKIFKNDDDQDRLFYKCLFGNYGQYSLNFNNYQVLNKQVSVKENGREEFVNDIIESRCLPALQVLIQHYNYKPTNGNLQHAIKQGALKFIKLLLSPEFNLHITNLPIPDDNFKNVKSLNCLLSENYITANTIPKNIIKLKSVVHHLPLKPLLIVCKLILSTSSAATTISVEEIESFLTSCPKQELKLPLSDKSNQEKGKKSMIIKLFDLYYSFIGVKEIERDEFYQIYFNVNYTTDKGRVYRDKIGSYLSSFQFANFNMLEKSFFINFSTEILAKIKDQTFLFTHCIDGEEGTKERKIKFIYQIVNSIKCRDDYISPLLFFYLIIYNDDLELVQYASNELGDLISIIDSNSKLIITQYIKSRVVLDWLFDNHFKHFNNTPSIWYFKNVDLLIRYESLYTLKYYTSQDDEEELEESIKLYPIHNHVKYLTPHCDIGVLNHIFKSGQSVFKLTTVINQYSSIIDITNDSSLNDKFEMSKLFYLNYNCNQINYLKNFIECYGPSFSKYPYLIKFMDWLYVYHNHVFITDFELHTTSAIIQNVILLKIGRINTQSIQHSISLLYKSNTCLDNIQFIDFFLSTVPKLSQIQYDNLLDCLIVKGYLNSLQHIQQHHNWLLSNKTTDQINQLVNRSLSTFNLEISKYLLKLFSITKFDLKLANDISMVHFRNFQN